VFFFFFQPLTGTSFFFFAHSPPFRSFHPPIVRGCAVSLFSSVPKLSSGPVLPTNSSLSLSSQSLRRASFPRRMRLLVTEFRIPGSGPLLPPLNLRSFLLEFGFFLEFRIMSLSLRFCGLGLISIYFLVLGSRLDLRVIQNGVTGKIYLSSSLRSPPYALSLHSHFSTFSGILLLLGSLLMIINPALILDHARSRDVLLSSFFFHNVFFPTFVTPPRNNPFSLYQRHRRFSPFDNIDFALFCKPRNFSLSLGDPFSKTPVLSSFFETLLSVYRSSPSGPSPLPNIYTLTKRSYLLPRFIFFLGALYPSIPSSPRGFFCLSKLWKALPQGFFFLGRLSPTQWL